MFASRKLTAEQVVKGEAGKKEERSQREAILSHIKANQHVPT